MAQQSEHYENVLIWALPASGKSEVMTFIRGLTAEQRAELHFGNLVEIDDYPRVASLFQIDDERQAAGLERVFTREQDYDEGGFVDSRLWSVLDQHLNARHRELLAKKPNVHDDSTVMLECARGGSQNAGFPLLHGYQNTLRNLDHPILEKAVILYVEVTPEQSRAKNDARYDPNDPNSILAHRVPTGVMERDYGCDDVCWMMERAAQSDHQGFVQAPSGIYVPIGVLDNRSDLTSFVREKGLSQKEREDKSASLYLALKEVLEPLHQRYVSR
ncbi:hypothetical protein HYY69_06960 [Candidatus Woesearchaeota archaeon]|nr:hypothetical protein [Candidatus Woesearchaeota archaeon]